MLNVFGLLPQNAQTIRRSELKTTIEKSLPNAFEHGESDLMGMHELKINFESVYSASSARNWNKTAAVFFNGHGY